jgi:hypothetical protein
VFSIADLRRHATVDAALAEALDGLTNLQIGKRLRACAAAVASPYRVVRVKRTGVGLLWAVVQVVDDLHHDPRVFDDDDG